MSAPIQASSILPGQVSNPSSTSLSFAFNISPGPSHVPSCSLNSLQSSSSLTTLDLSSHHHNSNDTTDAIVLFSPTSHTCIQFGQENGDISVNASPGIGIYVVLDCAPTISQTNSNLSESNILLPVEGLAHPVINDHSMLTHGKRGISQKRSLLCVLSSSGPDSNTIEPISYKQAMKLPAWKQAMQEEYDALIHQKTLTLVHLPPDKNLVSCKWIFKIKKNTDGSIATHRACLVARGFRQEYEIDYEETFSLVVRHTTIRLILGLAANFGWQPH